MEYAYIELEKELKQLSFLIDADGNLLKQLVIDKIQQLDKEVISLVLKSPQLKDFFTTKIDDTLILDKAKLLAFVQAREFIPNSFTEFTNTVGLYSSSKFIHTSDSVVLDFPYKDCVLLGNQSKEENEGVRQKFFHEVINFQEINKLFTRKVMCDFVKHTINGAVKVTSVSPTDNLIIKGNNLVALHALSYLYAKKVKLIYIDPPYNTESLKFAYNDKFDQATWLVFMKNRLEQAKQLLSDDGVIVVSIDNKQLCHLKILMDSVFIDGFVTIIPVELSTTQGMKVSSAQKGNVVKNSEYLLVYSKNTNKAVALNPLYVQREWDHHYSSYLNDDLTYITLNDKMMQDSDISKIFKDTKLSFKEAIFELYSSNSVVRDWIHSNATKIFRTAQIELTDIQGLDIKEGHVVKVNKEKRNYHIKKNQKGKIDQLLFLEDSIGMTDDFEPCISLRKIRGDWWAGYYRDMMNLDKEGNVKLDNGKKPERLIADIIKMFTSEKDIVLDYHLGSGTTCAVAHKMGRQYIGIEQLDYVENDSIVRLNNVIKGDKSGISKKVDWKDGGSFISMKLYSLVDSLLEQVVCAKSKEELKKIIDLLLTDEYFIYLGIDSEKMPYETIFASKEFENLSLEQQREIVHKSIDKNNLYVDYDNLHDASVKLTDEEKTLNELFYKGKKHD